MSAFRELPLPSGVVFLRTVIRRVQETTGIFLDVADFFLPSAL